MHCSGTYGKAVESPTSHNRTTHINITHQEITTIQMSLSNNTKWEFSIGVVNLRLGQPDLHAKCPDGSTE